MPVGDRELTTDRRVLLGHSFPSLPDAWAERAPVAVEIFQAK